jgi:signal transduction histidine kinase
VTPLTDVLVVDDNELDRELVRRLLPRGTPVRDAATAAEARAHLGRAVPDLVLLDNRLPDADGVDLLPLFAAAHVPVVMLTEVGAPEVIVSAMQRGAEDYLVKGALTREGLAQVIGNAVEKSALRRQLRDQHDALVEQARMLEARNRDIRDLAARLTVAEQTERERIAHVLHDDLQQQLFGLSMVLSVLQRAPRGPEVAALSQRATEILGAAVDLTRTLAAELSPAVLQADRLGEVLTWVAGEKRAKYGLAVDVDAQHDIRVSDPSLRILLYQMLREVLFNVAKHSGTMSARIIATTAGDRTVIRIEDDGAGFDPEAVADVRGTGFGLASIRERLDLVGGRFEIESGPGRGTRVTLSVPRGAPQDAPEGLVPALPASVEP